MTPPVGAPFNAILTPHFRLGEFALNDPRRRFTAMHQIETAYKLASFLEDVRAYWGGPVIITSGYRPWSINAAIGGAKYSEHLFDEPGKGAVDFYLPHHAGPLALPKVEQWIDARWPYSLGLAARSGGFIHLGMRPQRKWVRWNY